MSDWRHRARCRDVEPETFFPIGTTGPAVAQIEAAKSICALCPVREECLEWALGAGPSAEAGIWGGLTEEERRALRRGQRRRMATPSITHGTPSAYGHHRCRCPVCVAGNSRRMVVQRARKKASA